MIKKALEYIIGQSKPQIEEINGRMYSDKSLCEVREPKQSALNLSTLSGLIDYIVQDPDATTRPLIIQIESPRSVTVKSAVDKDYRRHNYLDLSADLPNINLGRHLSQEEFIIQLQTCFDRTGDWDNVIQIASNIKIEEGVSLTDDGTSQSVTAKTGVARVSKIELPNPVMLAPIRSFHEIEQPLVPFVFRIDQSGRMGLFEADGGAWKAEAVSRIKGFIVGETNAMNGVYILS